MTDYLIIEDDIHQVMWIRVRLHKLPGRFASTVCFSSSSLSHLVVRSLRQTQFPFRQFCHGLHLSSFRWLSCLGLTKSIHLCFGLLLFLLQGGTIYRVFLPTYSLSRLFTWPNHLSLAFLHLFVMFSTFSMSLMSSFLTWFLLHM